MPRSLTLGLAHVQMWLVAEAHNPTNRGAWVGIFFTPHSTPPQIHRGRPNSSIACEPRGEID